MKILAAKIGNETKNLYRSDDENDEKQILYGQDSFFHQKDTPIYLEDRQKIGIFANAEYIKKLFTI